MVYVVEAVIFGAATTGRANVSTVSDVKEYIGYQIPSP